MKLLPALVALLLLLAAAPAHAGGASSCLVNWTNVPSAPGPVQLQAGETAYGSVRCGAEPTVAVPPEHGVLSELEPLLVIPGASFNYRPDAAYRGRDQFTLRVTDGGSTIDTIVLIDVVGPIDDAPTCGGVGYFGPTGPNGHPRVEAGTPLELTLPCGDPEGETLGYAVLTAPAHGTVALGTPDRFGVRATYTPRPDYTGVDTFTLRMTDGPHVLEHRFTVDVVAPAVVVTPQPEPAIVPSSPLIFASGAVGPAVQPVSSPLQRRIAKACGKLEGTRRAACVKRETALAKCATLKTRTKAQRTRKAACVKRARR